MPVRNCMSTIAMAVRSILNQTFRDWQLIVIDDGSSDGTIAQVRQLNDSRIVLCQDGQSKGLPARLNEAIGSTSTQYFARMDGDDVSYPERIELQVDYLRSHPEVDLVGGRVLVFGTAGKIYGKRHSPERHQDICRRPHAGFPLAHPTFCGKTSWFRRYRYTETLLSCQDQDLLLRGSATSCYANLPTILLGYREELNLGKLLQGRRYFARFVFAEYLRRHRPVVGCLAVMETYCKGALDIIALLTGLKYSILRQRAQSVTAEESAAWRKVWATVNNDGTFDKS
jgi:glycosyltransferase involved in cell wall biosynthesis